MKSSLTSKTIRKVLLKNIFMTIMLIAVICAVVVLSLIPPHILKTIVDKNLAGKTMDGLMMLAFAYVGVLLFIGIFDFLKNWILTVFGQKIVKELRIEMMYKLQRINTMYFSNNSSGEITSRFTNDVDTVSALFSDGIVSMIIDCFKIIGIIISMWQFSISLGIIAICLIPFIYFITRIFQKKMLKAQIQNLEEVGKVNNHISESLKNIHMIKSFSKEKYMEMRYGRYLEDNFHTIEKVNFYDSCYSPIIQVTRAFVIALIVVLSSKQLNIMGISLGMVAASIEFVSNLFSPIESLGMELQDIQEGISGIQRINSFYNEKEDDEKDKSLTYSKVIGKNKKADISFNNLSFSYTTDEPILKNINLDVSSSENVTFIGRTGVGKTTLFKLIMGLLKPAEGSIEINGYDVYKIPNSSKRRIFGYVEQNFSFVKGTVKDQITCKDESITMEEVKKAMAVVGLDEYIESMKDSYDTKIDDKNSFSQGQKQLLSIARAIVTDPPILLLDEITANLDSATEERVVSVLKKAGENRTILSISHRLSSMLYSDRIVVLKDGRIDKIGSALELEENDEWFRKHLYMERKKIRC